MSDASQEHDPDGGQERRNELRRRVLLLGTIADLASTPLAECTIRGLSDTGAQIRLRTDEPLPGAFYLVDAKHHRAHRAETVWRDDDLMGVKFRETVDLDGAIPLRLKFLKRLLGGAKLRQIEVLEAKGFALDDALAATGTTRPVYESWRRDGLLREEMRVTMERLLAENTNLLKTLAAARDD